MDDEVAAVEPPGPLTVGQRIRAEDSALGRRWGIHLRVTALAEDEVRHESRLPLGIRGAHRIRCDPLAEGHTLLTFG